MSEFKKYDSASKYLNFGARLTKDAEVKEFDGRKVVRVTFVDQSRHEADVDMWIEATAGDRQAELAAFLKKGDTLGVEGKLSMRKYQKDGVEKFSIGIRRAELHVPIELFVKLKERGFTPGLAGAVAKTAAKPLPPKAKPAARPVMNLDDE